MKAEDTVMNDEEMLQIIYAQPISVFDHSKLNRSADSCKRELCQAQAEQTFNMCREQHDRELKQLIEQATEKRNRIIKRIFEEIENFGWYKRLPYVRASVQALKTKTYKECGIDG